MQKLHFFFFLFLFGFIHKPFAQFLNNEEAKIVKNSKTIIGLTEDSLINKALLRAVENSWTLNEIEDALPISEALERQRAESGIIVIQLGLDVTYKSSDMFPGSKGTPFNMEMVTSSSGGYIGLNTKGIDEADIKQHLSYDSEAQFVFGLTSLQDAVNTIIDEDLSGMIKVRKTYNKRQPDLKGKTLYICEAFVDNGISLSDIKEVYAYDVEIMSVADFEEAIISKKENGVYLNFVSIPVGNTHVSVTCLVGSEDRRTYNLSRNGKVNSLNKKTLKNLKKLKTE